MLDMRVTIEANRERESKVAVDAWREANHDARALENLMSRAWDAHIAGKWPTPSEGLLAEVKAARRVVLT
jgi:hypothetical protein